MKHHNLTTKILTLQLTFSILVVAGFLSIATAQSANKIVAVVNGTAITERELDSSLISQLFPLEQQIHAIRKTALDNLVVRAVLEGEAKRQSISIEELMSQMTAGRIAVLPAEVDRVYDENRSAFGTMSPDEAKQMLRLDLENQARMRNYREAIGRLKQRATVELFLEEPRLPLIATGARITSKGASDAKITIVEFADFQCPYCKECQSAIKQVLKSFGGDVRLVFKHLPLDIHSEAFSAARAAFCAGEQGEFWKYHDALFATESLSPVSLTKLATDSGLSMPQFQACLTAEESRVAVLQDKAEATRFGIDSTPTFIINGKLVRGAIGFEEFKTLVERELKIAHNTSPRKTP